MIIRCTEIDIAQEAGWREGDRRRELVHPRLEAGFFEVHLFWLRGVGLSSRRRCVYDVMRRYRRRVQRYLSKGSEEVLLQFELLQLLC